jgi:hypothetical protein
VLVEVYQSFRRENRAADVDETPVAARPSAADAASEKE